MCGFSGIISNTEISSESILKSVSAIKHRGPDDTLLFADDAKRYSCELTTSDFQKKLPSIDTKPTSTFFFGFNRLSIVDLSDNGMQPFYDAQSDIAFMLNGEVYNYAELRKQFLPDESFQSETDSEVAFRLYLRLGDDFVHHLRGMFSIVLYDFKTKHLKAWRDRLGMKPFYYSLIDGVFVFSSEMKGIFATNLIRKEINYQGLAYSMYLTTCPSPLTIFKNVHSLQAGFRLDYKEENQSISLNNYWHLSYSPAAGTASFSEFQKDVQEICDLHQTGDVPKAIMLSGGMDSGMLAYYLGKGDQDLRCLNIFTENHSTDEREYAAENARNANLPIEYIQIPESPTEEDVREYMLAEEEPNCSPEAALFLCKNARKMGYKVLYNALGPDELFGGYPYFKTMTKILRYKSLFPIIPASIIPAKHRSKYAELRQFGVQSFPLISRRLFSWEEVIAFLHNVGEEVPEHPIQYLLNQIEAIYPGYHQLPVLKKASYLEIFYYIASHHTFRSDQPSMRYSIEMRFPFLDHIFIQKYFNHSAVLENIDSELKPVFKQYAMKILPSKIFEMQKKGFSMPTDKWLNMSDKADEKQRLLTAHKNWYQKMRNLI